MARGGEGEKAGAGGRRRPGGDNRGRRGEAGRRRGDVSRVGGGDCGDGDEAHGRARGGRLGDGDGGNGGGEGGAGGGGAAGGVDLPDPNNSGVLRRGGAAGPIRQSIDSPPEHSALTPFAALHLVLDGPQLHGPERRLMLQVGNANLVPLHRGINPTDVEVSNVDAHVDPVTEAEPKTESRGRACFGDRGGNTTRELSRRQMLVLSLEPFACSRGKGISGVPSDPGDIVVHPVESRDLLPVQLLPRLEDAAPLVLPPNVDADRVHEVSKSGLGPVSPQEIIPADSRGERTQDEEQRREDEAGEHPREGASNRNRPEGVDKPPGGIDDRLAGQIDPTSGSCK